jgi:glutathione peroxidase
MRTRLAAAALGALALAALPQACGKRGDGDHPSDSTRSSTAMSFYSFSAAPLGSDAPVSLEKYQGKVLLVANTAAHCGYTPQYKPLGEVDRKYADRGLRVLGFVSDDFGHQAGTTDEVKACSLDNKATFDQFAEMHVKKGPDQHPLFAWLTSQPGQTGDVAWNFNKWLIGKSGEVLARWPSKVAPDAPEVTLAIEKALAAK